MALIDFVRESNRIEGITREPTEAEITATREFLIKPTLVIDDLIHLVEVYAPGHCLRDRKGRDVRVGDYIAPRGGPEVRDALEALLVEANKRRKHAWQVHIDYECLHPFTDGNGRSGRALWLWMMGDAPLGFLHEFYYQTLANAPHR